MRLSPEATLAPQTARAGRGQIPRHHAACGLGADRLRGIIEIGEETMIIALWMVQILLASHCPALGK
jgi:hypothetical protein